MVLLSGATARTADRTFKNIQGLGYFVKTISVRDRLEFFYDENVNDPYLRARRAYTEIFEVLQ